MKHCLNNSVDRSIGEYWEKVFCRMAYEHGKCFTPHQWKRDGSAIAFNNDEIKIYTLPDITIWSTPGEHHEIKHKEPTRFNSIGLEKYRYDSLFRFKEITKQDVLYTIHNHKKSGGRDSLNNNINQWITAKVGVDITSINAYKSRGYSYVSGQKKEVDIYYWDIKCFTPLYLIWNNTI